MNTKAQVRAEVRARIRSLAGVERAAHSGAACRRAIDVLAGLGAVMVYMPMEDELDIAPACRDLLARGARASMIDSSRRRGARGRGWCA